MDEETDFSVLNQTFSNIVKYSLAFIIDLGDTLMFGDYGIHYILVPQPGISRMETKKAEEYGYNQDDTLPSAGFLNISVDSDLICISYIKTDKNNRGFTIADEFTIQRQIL